MNSRAIFIDRDRSHVSAWKYQNLFALRYAVNRIAL